MEKVQFKAKNVEIDDKIRSYALEKIQSIERLIHAQTEDPLFEIWFEKELPDVERYRADITVYYDGNKTHAVGHGETLNAALDEAKDELIRRLRREKRKNLTLLKKGARKVKEMLRWGR